MANVRKNRQGKWSVQIRKLNQKNIYKTFISKATATAWAKEVETLIDKKQFEDYSDSTRFTFGELVEKYRNEITPKKKGKREETYKLNFLIRHDISKHNLLELQTKHIYEFKAELLDSGKAPATINKYLHYIYTIWETAKVEWSMSLPPRNPATLVKKEKVRDKIDRILSKEEYASLINASKQSNLKILTDMIQFAYLTAMRFGEIVKLNVEDINFETKIATLNDTKNGETRHVPLSDQAIEICLRNRFGEKLFNINRDRFKWYFNQACRKAGVENFRFHDLRACAITNLFLNGWSIAEVSTISGHKSWSELKKYTRVRPNQLLNKLNKVYVVGD